MAQTPPMSVPVQIRLEQITVVPLPDGRWLSVERYRDDVHEHSALIDRPDPPLDLSNGLSLSSVSSGLCSTCGKSEWDRDENGARYHPRYVVKPDTRPKFTISKKSFDGMVKAFRQAWAETDRSKEYDGTPGARTSSGLRAALDTIEMTVRED